jgi:hypothetical protein
MDYTFHSTSPNFFHQVRCPINDTVNHKVSWYIKSIIGACNIKVIDEDDYISFRLERVFEIHPDKAYFDLTNEKEGFMSWFSSTLSLIGLTFEIDGGGRWCFTSNEPFEIIGVSYYFKQVLGLYYQSEFPLQSSNNQLQIQASGYRLGSSFWFALSNLGSMNSVCMRIFNTFTPNGVFHYDNQEFVANCNSGALSDLIISIVDENMRPIRFTNPIHLYIVVQDCGEERQNYEPFQTLPPNPVLQEKIRRKRIENKERKEKSLKNLLKYDPTADRENEDLEFPLKSPEQEDAELRSLRNNIAKNNTDRDKQIKELQEDYQENQLKENTQETEK